MNFEFSKDAYTGYVVEKSTHQFLNTQTQNPFLQIKFWIKMCEIIKRTWHGMAIAQQRKEKKKLGEYAGVA